jgi:hypothetical protein
MKIDNADNDVPVDEMHFALQENGRRIPAIV